MEQVDKINISTKALSSGNLQVKFFVEGSPKQEYGYLLVNEPKPVGEIIAEIQNRLARRRAAAQRIDPLFPIAPQTDDLDFYLFSA
ncbi:hypothetical protein [Algoriphagus formosus]|uniref:hypothetical protein n=1 Tax=Algoriphagus formosus TaxID=2007308 RepID=UPI003F718826